MNKVVATAVALLGSAALVRASNLASGRAVVVNKCSYPVYVNNVPAAGEGGVEDNFGALAPGQTYSAHWEGLGGHHDGWSIKLSKTAQLDTAHIFQYEYTYQPTIDASKVWLDMSSVDNMSNPWLTEGWTVESSLPCSQELKQMATYTYAYDDEAGMQPTCPSAADFTVTLCQFPGGLGGWATSPSWLSTATPTGLIGGLVAGATSLIGGIASDVLAPLTAAAAPSASSTYVAPAVPTTTATPTSTAAPVPTSAPAASSPSQQHAPQPTSTYSVAQHDSASAPSPTTLVTSYAPKTYGTTVVEVETAWVTEVVTVNVPTVTEYATRRRARHMHHAAHNA
jgi:hypothetical protein